MAADAPRVISATSKGSQWGLKTFEDALRPYVHFQRTDVADLQGDLPGGFHGAFLHNTVGVSDAVLRNSVVYMLQTVVNKVKRDPAVAERLRRVPPREVWCNTLSAVRDLELHGVPARAMYRPAPTFQPPQRYVPLPGENRILWYYKPDHKFMMPMLADIHRLLDAIDDIEILLFPSDTSPVNKGNIRALGRVDLADWVPKVRGMARVSSRLDFGRSTFDVLAHGRWVLYYGMDEEIVHNCPSIEAMPGAIRELLAHEDDEAGRRRFEAAQGFALDRLSVAWADRLATLFAPGG